MTTIRMINRPPAGATTKERLEAYSMPVTEAGCQLWLASTGEFGYGQLWVEGRRWQAHRISYQEHVGLIPEGLCVLHRCDTPPCIRPDHLFLGTPQDNTDDMMAKNRHVVVVGSAHPSSKLDEATVTHIKHLLETTTLPTLAIARQFGVEGGTISQLQRGRSWKHTTGSSIGDPIMRPPECRKTVLTSEIVLEIVKLSKETLLTQRQIGKQFNIDHSAVSYILAGRSWGHLTGIKYKRKPRRRLATPRLGTKQEVQFGTDLSG